VHDARLVRGIERRSNLPGRIERFVNRERPPCDPDGQRLPLDQFQDQVPVAVQFLESMNPRDVLMAQRGQQPCLALETRQPLRIERKCRRQHLDRHIAPQPRITGAENFAHATGAKRGDDFVGAEAGTGGQ